MNILHLESSPGWGGQEIRILKEALGMRKRGYNVIIAVEKDGGLIQKCKEQNFKTYEIRFKKLFWLISFFKLLIIIKKNKIDIINTHSSSDAWLGGIIAKILKIPVIRTRHLSTAIKKGLNSKLLYGKLADFVVTTCSEIVPMISKQAEKPMNFLASIPTGVNIKKIICSKKNVYDFRMQIKAEKDDLLIGTVCFMRSWKGIDDFLKAANILSHEKKLKWLIIGGGHKDKYVNKAKALGLKNVIFTDHLENPYPAIGALDIFVLLSTAHEGVSQASLQAAYLQKPLITTPTGGLKEVCIDNLTGISVPIFSPTSVVEAVMKLKNEKSLREKLGINAKKLVEKNFTDSLMFKKMEDVYLATQSNN